MNSQTETYPSVGQAALLLVANLLWTCFAGLLLGIFRGPLHLSPAQVTAFAGMIGTCTLLVRVVRRHAMAYGDLLHPSRSSVLSTTALLLPPVLLLVPLLVLLNIEVGMLLVAMWPPSRWEQPVFELMADDSVIAVAYVCVLAPVMEEMLFRGIMLRGFLQRYPRWLAIAASAFLFGVAHLNIYQFAVTFSGGFLLGWLYERSRSLVPCIALHMAMNTALIAFSRSMPPDAEFHMGDVPLWTWSLSITAAVAGTLFLLRTLGNRSALAD